MRRHRHSTTTFRCIIYLAGCEYGDQVAWCQTYSELNCNDPVQASQCCNTCQSSKTTTKLRYSSTVTTTLARTTTRLTTRSTPTTPTTITTTILPQLTTTVAAVSGSCPLGDGASFCSTITGDECYYYAQLCCQSCPQFFTGIQGKLFVFWQIVLNSVMETGYDCKYSTLHLRYLVDVIY